MPHRVCDGLGQTKQWRWVKTPVRF